MRLLPASQVYLFDNGISVSKNTWEEMLAEYTIFNVEKGDAMSIKPDVISVGLNTYECIYHRITFIGPYCPECDKEIMSKPTVIHTSSGSKLEYEKVRKDREMYDKSEQERGADIAAERMELPKALKTETKYPLNEPMLQFFEYAHLPFQLQSISQPFCHLASIMVDTLPRNPERTVMLRKLLEAKDCAVRSQLYKG